MEANRQKNMSSLGAMASSKRKREIEGVGNKSMIDLKAVLYQTEAGNGKRAKDVEVKRVRHMINVDINARTWFHHAYHSRPTRTCHHACIPLEAVGVPERARMRPRLAEYRLSVENRPS